MGDILYIDTSYLKLFHFFYKQVDNNRKRVLLNLLMNESLNIEDYEYEHDIEPYIEV